MTEFTFTESLLVAVVGIIVVFFGLVILIMLIKLMGVLTGNMGKKEAPKAAPASVTAAPAAAPAPEGKLSPAKFDDQTVAVITAAIAAVRGEGYPFQIKRIVRVKQ